MITITFAYGNDYQYNKNYSHLASIDPYDPKTGIEVAEWSFRIQ